MLKNSKIIIDTDICTKCKACVNMCRYYSFESDSLCLTDDFEEECIECGKCAAVCPVNAIRLKSHLNEVLKKTHPRDALPSFENLTNLFETRRSRRQFKQESVPKELIEKLLNTAGKYFPTGHNQENVFYTIVQNRDVLKKLTDECNYQVKNIVEKFEDPQGRESLEKVFPKEVMEKVEELIPTFKRKLNRIEQGHEVWHWDAELIILHSPKDSLTLIENCSLAAGQIMLAAETLALGTCSLGYITAFFNLYKSLAKIVKIPRKHTVGYTLAIGYPKAHYYRIPARKPLKTNWF